MHPRSFAPGLVVPEAADWTGAFSRRLTHARWLWPYGALVLVVAAAVWPAWVTADRLVIGGDTLLIHYPWFVMWRNALASGEFPFWNPYTFSGLPAFATFQAGYAYPPHWLFTPVPAIVAINWLIGLHVLLAGVGAAWCAGRLGASREGQVLAGAAYALGSAMTARMFAGHLSFLEANAWLPFATGLAFQIHQRRAIVLLALAVALMSLAGQPELLIFSLWWLPLWGLAPALRQGWLAVLGRCVRLGVAVGLGIALAAFLLVPGLMLLAISNRQAGMSWDFATVGSLPPWHLLGSLVPGVFGEPGDGTYWPGAVYEWHERLLYIGVAPLLAATWAPRPWRWLCWTAAGLSIALAFGRFAAWYAWAQVLPGYANFRVPGKHLVLASLALAIAAGLGLERMRGRRVAVVALLGASALGLLAWLAGSELLPTFVSGPTGSGTSVRLDAGGLEMAGLLLVAIAVAAQLPAPPSRLALIVISLVDLFVVLGPYRLQIADPESIASLGQDLRKFSRAAVVGPSGGLLANYGPVLQVVQPGGYTSLFSGQYAALLSGNRDPGVMLGVQDVDDPALMLLGYQAALDAERGVLAIQEMDDGRPPPQAWVARCVWPGGAAEVRAADFPRQSCVTRAGAVERQQAVPPGPATVAWQRAGYLSVDAGGPGWLVTTVPWYPGWSALLDGAPTSVETVDGALVGLELPPGQHRVTFSYQPAGLELGAFISVLAAVVLLALWRAER